MSRFKVGDRVTIKDIEYSNGVITDIRYTIDPNSNDLYSVLFDDGEDGLFYFSDLIHESEV